MPAGVALMAGKKRERWQTQRPPELQRFWDLPRQERVIYTPRPGYPRDKKIADLLNAGMRPAAIAKKLGLTLSTVTGAKKRMLEAKK